MLQFRLFQKYPELVHGVFDKKAGNVSLRYGPKTDVEHTLGSIASSFDLKSVISVIQIHSRRIIAVDQANLATLRRGDVRADGLISHTPNLLLLIKTADCFPIFLFDPIKKVVGLIHVGWRGAVKGIHGQALKAFENQYRSRLQDILIGIGPGICARCFISKNKPEQSADPRWQPCISKKDDGWQVDIRSFVIEELKKLGIKSNHLETMNHCTFENNQFFSHRRSQETGELEGHFANVIGLRND